MDITEALEAALADVKAAIPHAKAEAEKAARHVAELQEEERGLHLALARHSASVGTSAISTTVTPTPPTEPAVREATSAEPHGDWTSLNNMDAVLRVLTEAQHPLSPREIVAALQATGRSDNSEQVRAALAYLKRLGHVSLLSRAQWIANRPADGTQGQAEVEADADDATPMQAYSLIERPPLPGSNGLASSPTEEVMR